MNKIIIINCGNSKIWDGADPTKIPAYVQAKDAYTGIYTRAKIKYCEKMGLPWYIFSAKWGIVTPSSLICNYNVKYNPNHIFNSPTYRKLKIVNPAEIKGLQEKVDFVKLHLPLELEEFQHNCTQEIIFIGGIYYYEVLKQVFNKAVIDQPFTGTIGWQIQSIQQKIKELG